MTDLDHKQVNDLAIATITVFSGLEEENFFLAQTHADNPSVPPGLVAILTITLRHDQSPQHPLVSERLKMPELVTV